MTPMRRPLRALPLVLAALLLASLTASPSSTRGATSPSPLTASQFGHRLNHDIYGYLP